MRDEAPEGFVKVWSCGMHRNGYVQEKECTAERPHGFDWGCTYVLRLESRVAKDGK